MTDTSSQPKDTNTDYTNSQIPNLRVLSQYVRDLSFENPAAGRSANETIQPKIDMAIDVTGGKINDAENAYEVGLKITARALVQDRVVFIVELLYCGIFEITGFPQRDMEPIITIECPRLLFPFARQIIANVTREGGFQNFLIEPIDFAQIYRARQSQAQAQNLTEGGPAMQVASPNGSNSVN